MFHISSKVNYIRNDCHHECYPPGHPSEFLATGFSKLFDFNVTDALIEGDYNYHLKFPISKGSISHQFKFINALCKERYF